MNYSTGYNAQAPAHEETHEIAPAFSRADALLLVEERPLIGDALALALQRILAPFPVRAARDIEQPAPGTNHLVVYNFVERDLSLAEFEATVRDIRRRTRSRPLAILTDSSDPEIADILKRYALQGWIDASLGFQVVAAALHMILMGARFLPLDPSAPAHVSRRVLAPQIQPVLTERERDVLKLLQQGKPNKVIAYDLQISQSTVKVHLQNLMRKLSARNRTQIVLHAARLGTD
ncbi:response regulator transcription factor [Methylovirgula sp. 4M-Z18]|uniref:response regulator transcription factor n=1 Tax=Methylovirgula sp. 4M-Z18 TaxID=2293567 RepID=UPI000E2E6B72|nr:response regulator transcription factor [Methylovirgula sp. 4M-Z18]RFB81343.1 DNA-binding response regulator [Methylovirgula sp. 4M-Z18]